MILTTETQSVGVSQGTSSGVLCTGVSQGTSSGGALHRGFIGKQRDKSVPIRLICVIRVLKKVDILIQESIDE